MSVVGLGKNISSLNTQRKIDETSAQISSTFERLSTGLRINRASDDAAGLSIAESLRTNVRVYGQGIRNISDGISLLNVADGAVEQLTSIVERQKELATQAANGAFSLSQRRSLQKESDALVDEYNRIVASTKFNDRTLLDGNLNSLSLQFGFGTNGQLQSSVGESLERTVAAGTFSAATTLELLESQFGAINAPIALIGDLNNDGKQDVVGIFHFAITQASVALGNGDGTFNDEINYTSNVASHGKIQDINKDGNADLITGYDISIAGSPNFTVQLGNGDGSFQAAVSYATTNDRVSHLEIADLNEDGSLDVVTSSSKTSGRINIFYGTGTGTFGAPVSFTGGTNALNPTRTYAQDINGDTHADIISQAGGNYYVSLGTGTGTFGATQTFSGSSSTDFVAVDANRDGVVDIIENDGLTIRMRIGNGDGTFQSAQSLGSIIDRSTFRTAKDINGDGTTDLMLQHEADNGTGTHYFLYGRADGTFAPVQSIFVTGGDPFISTMEDLNSDGVPDLVVGDLGNNNIQIRLAETQDSTSLPYLSLTTVAGAREALSTLESASQRISLERASTGATLSRLESTFRTTTDVKLNSEAARSRIVDADIAQESANLVRSQVLQQAQTAVLAQANQIGQLVLSLLR